MPNKIAVVGERGNLKKTIVYPASRKFYVDVFAAVNSALQNVGVDEICLMIQDDQFPFELPERVRTINVSAQQWFAPGSPNFRNEYAFICLVRTALSKLFPDLDRILSLDADTIITRDISDLWDLDMDEHYVAGVPELTLTGRLGRPYINAGMMFFNLDKIRADCVDDRMIKLLNQTYLQWFEQDAVNECCYPGIMTLGSEYNCSRFSEWTDYPRIVHYAYTPGWQNRELVKKYARR